MKSESKAQQAALARVKQSLNEIRELIKNDKKFFCEHPTPMTDYDVFVELRLNEIAQLEKDHNLDGSVISNVRQEIIESVYEAAGLRGEHAWQAKFAKKYGL